MKIKEAEGRLLSGDQSVNQLRGQWELERVQLKDQLFAAQNQLSACEKQRIEFTNKVSSLEGKLREAESKLSMAEARIPTLQSRIQALEVELANLQARLNTKPELHSSSRTTETYKVKSFELAAKLAKMDGTDDGLYNGLPIEVEGEGLYRDLVARGRTPKSDPNLASLSGGGGGGGGGAGWSAGGGGGGAGWLASSGGGAGGVLHGHHRRERRRRGRRGVLHHLHTDLQGQLVRDGGAPLAE
eukprot:TRINITY_DN6259_c0_g1_i1.p1 TRINITY_DN6259_c0_g1~~TRINITY_DN6259_c0_g1_i1.p1  ORF type:complete len:243 (-),score=61.35 TRINITY_DN6259_c0_g1_i1:19-747(-)